MSKPLHRESIEGRIAGSSGSGEEDGADPVHPPGAGRDDENVGTSVSSPSFSELRRVEALWREAWEPSEKLSLPDFAERYVKIGPERAAFDLELYPWLREFMEVATDYRVPQQAIIAAAQLGKGRGAEAAIPYFVVEDPGDLTWYGKTNETASEYAEQRLMPLLLACDPVQKFLPSGGDSRHKIRKKAILFSHTLVEVIGANQTNTQSRTRRIIFCDEVWEWEAGMLASAIARTSSPNFIGRRKIIMTSTAGDDDSDLERYWDVSDQRVWHVRCPHCDRAHPLSFTRELCRRVPSDASCFTMKWDTNDLTRPSGIWNLEEVKKTVHMQCPSCQGQIWETPENMRHFRKTGHYIPMNPNASKEKAAFWVPRMAAGEWAALVERFLICNEERKAGFEDNLREFMIKALAEKWVAGGGEVSETNPTGDYDIPENPEEFAWDKEYARFMTVDHQAKDPRNWYLVQAWSARGESRVVECGHCNTWEEIEEIAERHNLVDGKASCVCVDCGYDQDDVWEQCAKRRWYAYRGDDALGYRHNKPGKPSTMRYYSPSIRREVGMGTEGQGKLFCIEYLWSNPSIKNFLARLKTGKGLYYGIARNIPDMFLRHMDSEFKKAVPRGMKVVYHWLQRGKRPNHLWDCACMQIVCAFRAGLIPVAFTVAKTEEDQPQIETAV